MGYPPSGTAVRWDNGECPECGASVSFATRRAWSGLEFVVDGRHEGLNKWGLVAPSMTCNVAHRLHLHGPGGLEKVRDQVRVANAARADARRAAWSRRLNIAGLVAAGLLALLLPVMTVNGEWPAVLVWGSVVVFTFWRYLHRRLRERQRAHAAIAARADRENEEWLRALMGGVDHDDEEK